MFKMLRYSFYNYFFEDFPHFSGQAYVTVCRRRSGVFFPRLRDEYQLGIHPSFREFPWHSHVWYIFCISSGIKLAIVFNTFPWILSITGVMKRLPFLLKARQSSSISMLILDQFSSCILSMLRFLRSTPCPALGNTSSRPYQIPGPQLLGVRPWTYSVSDWLPAFSRSHST